KAIYKEYLTINFDDGTATLNGKPFENGSTINENGTYTLVIVDTVGNAKTITFTVDNDEEWVNKDRDAIEIGYLDGDNSEHVTGKIELATVGENGSKITWTSSDENVISTDGTVSTPAQDTEVVLTAVVSKGSALVTKKYVVKVVADTVKPLITLIGDSVVTVEQGQMYVEKGVVCIDNNDGDITDKVEIEGFVDTDRIGEYVIIYKVTDTSGNITVEQRLVKVIRKAVAEEAEIEAANEERIQDEKISGAIEGAKQNNQEKIKIIVEETVAAEKPVKVSVSKEQVENAKKNGISMELETENTSIEIPLEEIDAGSMASNSRLELICEKVNTEIQENKVMLEAVKSINQNIDIYEDNVYDFKMKIIEEDESGNVIKEEEIENFQTEDEEIILRIVVGKDINEEDKFMTFYYNKTSKEWEYIKGEYEPDLGTMKLSTNHLSIYAIMYLTKEEKQQEMVKILNEEDVTVNEVLNIIEDPDMDFDSEAVEKYNNFTEKHKKDVAQAIINEAPVEGYTYESLKEKYSEAVTEKYDSISQDSVKPVITLLGDASIRIRVNGEYIEPGATAEDDMDGDITGRIVIIGEVDTAKAGEYILKYTVKDLSGNYADEVDRKVIVYSSGSKKSKNKLDVVEILNGIENIQIEK
ncbi:MAG: DUF5011 domain-containing protein, partial [Firmicutes bacterium]|nr:DUF5011 domain-containing protein [Bacillota bacterium]